MTPQHDLAWCIILEMEAMDTQTRLCKTSNCFLWTMILILQNQYSSAIWARIHPIHEISEIWKVLLNVRQMFSKCLERVTEINIWELGIVKIFRGDAFEMRSGKSLENCVPYVRVWLIHEAGREKWQQPATTYLGKGNRKWKNARKRQLETLLFYTRRIIEQEEHPLFLFPTVIAWTRAVSRPVRSTPTVR